MRFLGLTDLGHRGGRLRDDPMAAVFEIHPMRVNLGWLDGVNSQTSVNPSPRQL
jgi:hypothetical protein